MIYYLGETKEKILEFKLSHTKKRERMITMKNLTLNLPRFNEKVEHMIDEIKRREVNCVNHHMDFKGLFDDQIYLLNTVDFIDGLEEKDSYLAVPMYRNNHLSGVFLDDYSDDEDGNHEWLPSMEINFTLDQLRRIQSEIKKRRDEIE